MVPGMTERERLAADVRRLEWLAAARLGAVHGTNAPSQSKRAVWPPGIWRRGLTAALLLGQRILLLPEAGKPPTTRSPSAMR